MARRSPAVAFQTSSARHSGEGALRDLMAVWEGKALVSSGPSIMPGVYRTSAYREACRRCRPTSPSPPVPYVPGGAAANPSLLPDPEGFRFIRAVIRPAAAVRPELPRCG